MQALPHVFDEGNASGETEEKRSKQEVAQILASQGYKYAKNGFSNDVYIELQSATKSAGDGFKTALNSIIERLRADGKDSVYNVQKEVEKYLNDHKIFEVKYANGAKMPLHAYAAMAARSARIETVNIAAIGRALQSGTDLVKMTTMPGCCKLCAAYQGKVYSISGQDKRFPALFKTVLRNGYALPHPNCRHEFIAYYEDLEDPKDVERMIKASKIKYDHQGNLVDVRFQKDIEAYAAWQVGNRQLNRELLEYGRMREYYQGREEEMPYKSLGTFRTARRSNNLSPAFKKWKYRKADKNQYERWKEIIGEEEMPKTLDDFQEIKYNKNKQKAFEELRQIRAQEIDYKVAESGGAHSGKLIDYQKNYSVAALERTVKNLDEKIALHISKIDNPEQHYPDWKKRNILQREGSIKHWRKEISNFQKQKNIALAELRRRRKK